MTDTGVPAQGLSQQARFEVAQLPFSAPPFQMSVLDGRDTRAVVAAIFKPAQGVDEIRRDGFAAENADNPTHRLAFRFRPAPQTRNRAPEPTPLCCRK